MKTEMKLKMKNKAMSSHVKIIGIQLIFLAAVISLIYFIYPKTSAVIDGNSVRFSGNANIIIISENPDFSNPRYINLDENISIINLNPGTYYWKPANRFIEGLESKFTIESEVGLKINQLENETELANVGNVRVNVTRSKDGVMIGHVILEPEEKQEIEDSGNYTGRQEK